MCPVAGQRDEIIAITGNDDECIGSSMIEHVRVPGFPGQHAAKKKHLVACSYEHARDHVRHVVVEQKTHAIIAPARSIAARSTIDFATMIFVIGETFVNLC